jgi:hypothetical protein
MLFACYEKLRGSVKGAQSMVSAIAHQRIQQAIVDKSPSKGLHKTDRDFE